MVQVERRSWKERSSGVDHRRGYSPIYGGSRHANNWERRSGKDQGKSSPRQGIGGARKQGYIVTLREERSCTSCSGFSEVTGF